MKRKLLSIVSQVLRFIFTYVFIIGGFGGMCAFIVLFDHGTIIFGEWFIYNALCLTVIIIGCIITEKVRD